VNEAELDELQADCPTLYHMAERESWSSIKKSGLLSTSALLDRYGIAGAEREVIEAQRRPKSYVLEKKVLGRVVVRDQLPMDGTGLTRCLEDSLSPGDWYRTLNTKVFFWFTRSRLLRLLCAGAYRDSEHDVLELDARSLVKANREKIWLCPMNSGCTKPFPHPRGVTTFRRVDDYPYARWKAKRPRGERVVELAVDYAVPNIIKFVRRVVRMKGDKELEILFEQT
jgi:hypothetical protein